MLLHSGHITAWYSRHDSDILLCTQTSWAQVGLHREQFSSLCTAHFAPGWRRFPHLHGSGAGIPGIGILIYSWYCGIGISSGDCIYSRSRDAETSTWRAHGTDDWNASTVIKHCDERSSVGTRGSCENMRQSVSKPRPEDMRVGKPEPNAPGKDFDDWDLTFNGYAGVLDPAYPALLKTARQSQTVVMATPPHEQQSATLLHLLTMLTQKGARKVVRKSGNNGFEAYRQLCLMYGTSDQEGSTGLFVQIMTYKFGSKIEDVEDRLNEFLELVRRYDEANGTDPVPDQVKKACIISNTPELLKTHLQLNVGKLWNFNALRAATEDYLRSRRIFKTTSAGNTHDEDSMEVDAVSRKGKGKEKSGKGKKGKESHSSKGYGETTTEHSRFDGDCRNCGKYGHKASDCWYKQTTKSQVKARARESRNPRWQKSVRVTAVNKSMIGVQVQTRPHSSQIYLKWTRLDAQMKDSGYSRWKTARNVGTRWIQKISLVPLRLRSGKLRSTSWWSILDFLDMSAHRGFHHKFQWWVLQTSTLWQNNVSLQHYGQNVV